jgi:hypothetical protein
MVEFTQQWITLLSQGLCQTLYKFRKAIRVPGYRPRGPGFDFRRYQIFLRRNGPGTGSTQPHEYNCGVTWKKQKRLRSRNPRIRQWGSVALTLDSKTLSLISPTSGGRSVGIVRSRTNASEFCL